MNSKLQLAILALLVATAVGSNMKAPAQEPLQESSSTQSRLTSAKEERKSTIRAAAERLGIDIGVNFPGLVVGNHPTIG